jgi:hypothetical protein
VLHRHYQRISSGHYAGAFMLMSSRFRAKNPTWTSQPGSARPYINVVKIGPSTIRSGVAYVDITFYGHDHYDTPNSNTNCNKFEGTARMVKERGKWRYDAPGDYTRKALPGSLEKCNP